MSYFIGMDEAGYGPNLGPLVITATLWEVPDDPARVDFWELFDSVICQQSRKQSHQIQIADSKQVYSPSKGLRELERGVLLALRLLGVSPQTFQKLTQQVSCQAKFSMQVEPWFADRDLSLPMVATLDQPDQQMLAAWHVLTEQTGVRLLNISSDIVLTERFNDSIQQYGSKGLALSHISMQLLQHVLRSTEIAKPATEKILIVADKHGGRNRYADLLTTIADGELIFSREEGRHLSRYTFANTEVRFQTKAESHLPVALASMVCKYVRELSMELFNQFWTKQIPNLKPTKGYPLDAKRFRNDVAEQLQLLNIPIEQFWRER